MSYQTLNKNKNVKLWQENLKRGSLITADTSLRRLGNFCSVYKTTPDKLLKMNGKELYNLFMKFIADYEKKGYAGSYIDAVIKAVKSFLTFNDIFIKKKLKIRNAQDTPSLVNERVPTKEELMKILFTASKTARVCCVLMSQSGMRPQILGDYKGKDGLRIGDFPELKIENDKIIFEKIPTLVRVRKELSKAKHNYFTFLSEEGCGFVKDFLEERIRNGEELDKNTPLINPKWAKKNFITTTNIGDLIRNAIRSAGFKWRPYVLRCYFDTQLMLAESKGLVLRDYRTFWMGHKGDIENRYTTNKGRLPENIIEDMRSSYEKCQEFLEVSTHKKRKEDIIKIYRLQTLKTFGFTDEEISKIDYENISDKEYEEIIRDKLFSKNNNKNVQKVINEYELEQYLNAGWQFLSLLPSGKIIIKSPS